MIALSVASWLSVGIILLAYAKGGMRRYAWANAVLAWPVALPALLLGAYSSASINLAFGFIGVYHVVRGRR